MNNRCLAVLFLVAIPLSIAVAAPTKTARETTPRTRHRTVLDYFWLLPNYGYFEVQHRQDLLRHENAPVIDLKHDYLKFAGDGAQPHLEIAVFRYRGADVIAVSSTDRINYWFELWRYEQGKWKKVTEDLSPLVASEDLHFVLPRYGTTIKVYKSNGVHLADLYWDKGKFDAESFDPTGHPLR